MVTLSAVSLGILHGHLDVERIVLQADRYHLFLCSLDSLTACGKLRAIDFDLGRLEQWEVECRSQHRLVVCRGDPLSCPQSNCLT